MDGMIALVTGARSVIWGHETFIVSFRVSLVLCSPSHAA